MNREQAQAEATKNKLKTEVFNCLTEYHPDNILLKEKVTRVLCGDKDPELEGVRAVVREVVKEVFENNPTEPQRVTPGRVTPGIVKAGRRSPSENLKLMRGGAIVKFH